MIPGVGPLSNVNVTLPPVGLVVIGTLPAFTTFDLFTGVHYNNISMDLFAKNVTDERGLLNRYSLCSDAVCKQLYDVAIPPRTVGVRISQKF